MSRYLIGKKIDFRNSRTLCLHNIKTTRLWYEKSRALSARATTESVTTITSCMTPFRGVSLHHSRAAFAAGRQSHFINHKSRSIWDFPGRLTTCASDFSDRLSDILTICTMNMENRHILTEAMLWKH